jgi:hypothetical protein
MDDRPLAQGEVVRVAVAAVLVHRVLDALPGELVLELGRGDGDAVDEEGEVHCLG